VTVGATTAGIPASGSNIGNWMETVGAQWLLVSQPNNSILVALVQRSETPIVAN
jgi:hypothetical protein